MCLKLCGETHSYVCFKHTVSSDSKHTFKHAVCFKHTVYTMYGVYTDTDTYADSPNTHFYAVFIDTHEGVIYAHTLSISVCLYTCDTPCVLNSQYLIYDF